MQHKPATQKLQIQAQVRLQATQRLVANSSNPVRDVAR
jgi:hypothetical protein